MSTTKKQKTSHSATLKYLESFNCKSPLFPNEDHTVITCSSHATIPEAMQLLISNQILAVPVIDANTGVPVSVVSLVDLMDHFLKKFPKENVSRIEKHMFDFFSLQISQKEMQKEEVMSIQGSKNCSNFL